MNGKIVCVHGLDELILLNVHTTQSTFSHDIFHRTRRNNPIFYLEPQKTPNSQSNLEKEEQRYYAPCLQTVK